MAFTYIGRVERCRMTCGCYLILYRLSVSIVFCVGVSTFVYCNNRAVQGD